MTLTPSLTEKTAFSLAVDVIIHTNNQLSKIDRKLSVLDMNCIRAKSQEIYRQAPNIKKEDAFFKVYNYTVNEVVN